MPALSDLLMDRIRALTDRGVQQARIAHHLGLLPAVLSERMTAAGRGYAQERRLTGQDRADLRNAMTPRFRQEWDARGRSGRRVAPSGFPPALLDVLARLRQSNRNMEEAAEELRVHGAALAEALDARGAYSARFGDTRGTGPPP